MAGAAVLRSVASKMARAPPPQLRLSALRLHGRRSWLGHPFSSSPADSKPTINKDFTQYKKFLSWLDRTTVATILTPVNMACLVATGTAIYTWFWVRPAIAQSFNELDAAVRELSKVTERGDQSYHQKLSELHKSLEDGLAKLSEARTKQNSGISSK